MIKNLSMSEVETVTGNTNPTFQITEKEFRQTYPQGSESHNNLYTALSPLDKTTTLLAFSNSSDSSWKHYQPEYFLDRVLHTEIKAPDFAALICPNELTVPRDPALVLALEEGTDEAKKPHWHFLAEGASVDKALHTYERKSIGLRRIGTGWNVSFELLSDCTLDLLNHRATIAEAQRRIFTTYWLTAELARYTDGTYETAYSNTFQCDGTQTSKTDYNGDTTPTRHVISVDDILGALHKFSNALTPEQKAQGKDVRGQGYYQPTALVLPPATVRDLCREIFKVGYQQLGPENLSGQVRRTGMLSELFGVPVIACNTARWLPAETKTPNNFDLTQGDGYIIDQNLGPVNLVHSDGWLVQNWKNEDRRLYLWAMSKRSQYHVLDPLGVMRLVPASGS